MLQTLREKTSGKIATVILGLLIIPFAFFGVESYMAQRVETYVARISRAPAWWPGMPDVWPLSYFYQHHDIDAAAFRQRLETARMRARDQQGDAFDARAFESAENKRKLLDEMIDEEVMRLAAKDAGIVVSDAEIRQAIQDIPQFQVDGKFNPERYQLVLASQSPPQTPLQFQATVRDNLQMGLIPNRIVQSSFIAQGELERVLRLLGERRDVAWAVLPPPPADTAPVGEAEIKAWYEGHARDFRAPETVRLEYVEVDASKLALPAIDEAAVRKRYQEQAAKYASAEQREVSHILVQVPANASAADRQAAEARAAKLAAEARAPGADFAALARANSDDTGSKAKGGDLGWLTRASMPPAFAEAAFAMQPGEVRGPVKTDFGWHIIKVNQVRAGSQPPFEAVRAQLEQELAQSERERAFNETSGKLVDAVYKNPTALAPAAKAVGLPVQQTPAFTRAGGPGIAADPKVLRVAFSESLVQDGTASDPIELGPNRMVMIRVLEHTPERALPLAAVREQVIAAVRAERARKAAVQAAEALATAARAQGLAAAAAQAGLAVERADGIERGAQTPARALVEAFFAQPVAAEKGAKAQVGRAAADGRQVVFEVLAVHPGDPAQLPQGQREQLGEQLARAFGMDDEQAYVAARRARYQIKVAADRL